MFPFISICRAICIYKCGENYLIHCKITAPSIWIFKTGVHKGKSGKRLKKYEYVCSTGNKQLHFIYINIIQRKWARFFPKCIRCTNIKSYIDTVPFLQRIHKKAVPLAYNHKLPTIWEKLLKNNKTYDKLKYMVRLFCSAYRCL